MAYEGIRTIVAEINSEKAVAAAARLQDEVARREEETAKAALREKHQELSSGMFFTHRQAAILATKLLDYHGATPQFNDTAWYQPHFVRATPMMDLGEQYPDDQEGLTHGYAVVRAVKRAVPLTRSRRRFPYLSRRDELVGYEPSVSVSKVGVELSRGTADGNDTQYVAALSTANEFTCSTDVAQANEELAVLLKRQERAVVVLKELVSGMLPPHTELAPV